MRGPRSGRRASAKLDLTNPVSPANAGVQHGEVVIPACAGIHHGLAAASYGKG